MSDSPELRQFLADWQLEDYCYINHIAVNYRGSDRPGKGRLSRWLQQLSFLEEFQDGAGQACVRLREARTGGGAAEAPDLAVSPKAPPSAVPPAPDLPWKRHKRRLRASPECPWTRTKTPRGCRDAHALCHIVDGCR